MTLFEVFTQAIPKVKGGAVCTIYEAVGAVQDVIVSHLLMQRSDLLVSDGDVPLKFAAGKSRMMLPAEFLDLADRPFLADATRLVPFKGQGSMGISTGTPYCYRIRGQMLAVYPIPTEETVVTVPFYARPDKPTDMSNDLPFWGMFDSVFVDACVSVLELGIKAVAEAGFVAAIQSQVDLVLAGRAMNSEQLLADSINGF